MYVYNLGQRFYQVVDTFPNKIALSYPAGRAYSFAEINLLSNQIARLLLQSGVEQGDVVAIFNDKSVYGYGFMLACIKCGFIYSNLDVTSPLIRLQRILDTCKPRFIYYDIANSELQASIGQKFPEAVESSITGLIDQLVLHSDENLEQTKEVLGSNPAYIMFTSGSTGFPKGAVMSHSNVLNFIEWGKETFSVTDEDIFTNANPIYFDNSVFDFYVSLFNGSTLVPLGHDLVKNAGQLVQAINQSACTIWFSVPSLLVYLLTTRALKPTDFPTVKRIAFGGEGFPKNKLKQLFEMLGDRVTLFNVYGPTECTCICSSYPITKIDFENMKELAPLGYLAPNFGYQILPLDDNEPNFGELALIGPCVGLGYFSDPDRTKASFIEMDNFPYRQVMYKTGDVVKREGNGYLHFKGRIDNQIKHMGYRIELEEIEAAFSTLAYVNEVGVIYERLSPELGQIKAFIYPTEAAPDDSIVLNAIKNILPPYMIPRVIKRLPGLPKNSNGKVDRKQLAAL